jgi:acetyl esterase/lipase
VEYRKLGEPGAGYPGTFQDVATAVDRLYVEAPKRDLDLRRVVAVGHSAGGHLALWAASRAKLPEGSPLRTAKPLRISAVISLAGIGDLKGQGPAFALPCGGDTIERLVDTKGRKAPFVDTSPAELLPIGVRVVMVHGVYDHVLPPYIGRDYAEKARKAGDAAEVVVLPDAGHFDLVIPTTRAWAAINGILDREMKGLTH